MSLSFIGETWPEANIGAVGVTRLTIVISGAGMISGNFSPLLFILKENMDLKPSRGCSSAADSGRETLQYFKVDSISNLP
jgi:hypothetical protein